MHSASTRALRRLKLATAGLTSSAASPMVGALGMGSYAGYIVETFVTLLAVCSLAFVVLFGARKLGVGRAKGPIELVGQLPLDARRQIVLVKVGTQIIVVGVGEGGFSKLAEMPATELPLETPGDSPPFSQVIARVMGQVGKAKSSATAISTQSRKVAARSGEAQPPEDEG